MNLKGEELLKGEVSEWRLRTFKRILGTRTCLMESSKKSGAERGSLSFGRKPRARNLGPSSS